MLSPSELDKQSLISISRWIDIESQEARDMDPDIKLNIGKLCKLLTIGVPEDMLLILRSIGMQRIIDNNLLMNPDFDCVLEKLVRTV